MRLGTLVYGFEQHQPGGAEAERHNGCSQLFAFPGSALHLDGTGLTIQQLHRSRLRRWRDLSGFTVATVDRTQRTVVFDDASVGETRLAAMNRSLTGRGASLPDSYGLDPDDLAVLLAAWAARAAGNKIE